MLFCQTEREVAMGREWREVIRTIGAVRFSREEPLPDVRQGPTAAFWANRCWPCLPGYQRVRQAVWIDQFSRCLYVDILDVEVD